MMKARHVLFLPVLAALIVVGAGALSFAQESADDLPPPYEEAWDAVEDSGSGAVVDSQEAVVSLPPVKAGAMPSLFWTDGELLLIRELRMGLVELGTPDGEDETMASEDTGEAMGEEQTAAVTPVPRDLRLGGLVYHSGQDWVVWINGERITPDAVPGHIRHIRVGPDYVELKWYDALSATVFPVRLRPNQRFNLDSRTFLPG